MGAGGVARWPHGPAGLLPYMGYMMCGPKGYGFSAVRVLFNAL